MIIIYRVGFILSELISHRFMQLFSFVPPVYAINREDGCGCEQIKGKF